MKYVSLTLNWIFGLSFLLIGLVSIIDSFLAGISLVAISFFLLPPARNFIHSKTNKELSPKSKAISIFILFIAFSIFVSQSQSQKAQELAAKKAQEQAEQILKIQQENIAYFNDNREKIIDSIKQELSKKKYDSVISLSNKYLITDDTELNELNLLAKNKIAALKKDVETKRLLDLVKTLPSSELVKNNDIYKQLLTLHPDNKKYKDKVAFYSGKIEQQEKERIAKEERKAKIESQFSAWDGSHRNLERTVKNAMNDPDSYEHDKTVYWDKGNFLIVRMTYRGKNAFGGTVRNFVKAKVSLDGQILQILDQT